MESDVGKALKAVESLRPEVIIVEECKAAPRPMRLGALLDGATGGRVVTLSLDHGSATVYQRNRITATDPAELVRAIQGSGEPHIPGPDTSPGTRAKVGLRIATDPAPQDAGSRAELRALLAHAGFVRFLSARLLTSVGVQMQTVAVGWQVYEISRDPLDLGLIGLSQFLPFVVLVLPAGHFADRHSRQRLLSACYGLELLCALLLLAFSLSGLGVVWPVFAVMVLFGVARAFAMPTGQALLPNVVPPALFGRAVAVNSTTWQLSTIAGPAIGGLVYLLGAPVVYATVSVLLAAAVVLMFGVRAPPPIRSAESVSFDSLLEGLRFVFRRRIILGAISLDLFAVLFGGATALLPAYASDVLRVGPDGLGLLRAAPGVGAAIIALAFAWRPLTERVGQAMLGGVALFGCHQTDLPGRQCWRLRSSGSARSAVPLHTWLASWQPVPG